MSVTVAPALDRAVKSLDVEHEPVPWRPSARSDTFDVAVAAGLGVLAAVSITLGADPEVFGPAFADYARVGGWLLVTACIAPLAVRRRHPLPVAAVVTAAVIWLRIDEVPEVTASTIAAFIAIYSAAGYGGRRRLAVLVVCAVALGSAVCWDIARTAEDVPDGEFALAASFRAAVNVFQLGSAWFLGHVVRSRRQREAVLEAQAGALRQAADVEARRAVLAERMRIARELHDVLAHHVSVMGVQAAAARRVLGVRPRTAGELLGAIETSSRDAVGEMQRLLGLLRQDDDAEEGNRPQPTLESLPVLADQLREAGLRVDVDVDCVDGVPDAVGVSAFRIVQEALTNALKHSGPGTGVEVAVRRRRSSLELAVVDDGAGTAPAIEAEGTGHGLVGMRERVHLHGGELKAGRRPGGGYEVRAWFPL